MNKKLFAIIIGITLIAAAVPGVVLAANNAEQSASTLQATTIGINAQDGTTAVTTITFPADAPGATVSAPVNSEAETQVFGGAGVAAPVVTLASPGAYSVWLQVEDFSNSVVANEYYTLLDEDAACADASAVDTEITLNDTAFDTGIDMISEEVNDLYLKVTLGAVAGQSGTSTLTVLGES